MVPNAGLTQRWCEERAIPAERRDAEVKLMLMADMARIAAQAGLRPYEVPLGILLEVRRFALCACVCVCVCACVCVRVCEGVRLLLCVFAHGARCVRMRVPVLRVRVSVCVCLMWSWLAKF